MMTSHTKLYSVSTVFCSASKEQADKVSAEIAEVLKKGQASGDVVDSQVDEVRLMPGDDDAQSDYADEETDALVGLSYNDVFTRGRQSN
jgi:hypothetical protein